MSRLFISFSGGRTSGYMTKRLLGQYRASHECVVLFANTGLEHERTLDFVDKCDRAFGFNVVWVEAVVNAGAGNGTTHKVVDYLTASRGGQPFEEVIGKYGIPNKAWPHCTRETKLQPMTSYLRSIGWEAGSYDTAIGIRSDEADRMSSAYKKERFWYPLIEWRVTKPVVLDWWRRQAFDLEIPEHYGNCVGCWKKSTRKLLTIAKELPQTFDFFERMEQKHGATGAGYAGTPRVFFRGDMNTATVRAMARLAFEPWRPDLQQTIDELDIGSGCGESCEIGADA